MAARSYRRPKSLLIMGLFLWACAVPVVLMVAVQIYRSSNWPTWLTQLPMSRLRRSARSGAANDQLWPPLTAPFIAEMLYLASSLNIGVLCLVCVLRPATVRAWSGFFGEWSRRRQLRQARHGNDVPTTSGINLRGPGYTPANGDRLCRRFLRGEADGGRRDRSGFDKVAGSQDSNYSQGRQTAKPEPNTSPDGNLMQNYTMCPSSIPVPPVFPQFSPLYPLSQPVSVYDAASYEIGGSENTIDCLRPPYCEAGGLQSDGTTAHQESLSAFSEYGLVSTGAPAPSLADIGQESCTLSDMGEVNFCSPDGSTQASGNYNQKGLAQSLNSWRTETRRGTLPLEVTPLVSSNGFSALSKGEIGNRYEASEEPRGFGDDILRGTRSGEIIRGHPGDTVL